MNSKITTPICSRYGLSGPRNACANSVRIEKRGILQTRQRAVARMHRPLRSRDLLRRFQTPAERRRRLPEQLRSRAHRTETDRTRNRRRPPEIPSRTRSGTCLQNAFLRTARAPDSAGANRSDPASLRISRNCRRCKCRARPALQAVAQAVAIESRRFAQSKSVSRPLFTTRPASGGYTRGRRPLRTRRPASL